MNYIEYFTYPTLPITLYNVVYISFVTYSDEWTLYSATSFGSPISLIIPDHTILSHRGNFVRKNFLSQTKNLATLENAGNGENCFK